MIRIADQFEETRVEQTEITLSVTSGNDGELYGDLAGLNVGLERFETRLLTGAEAVILLVQASAPMLAAVGAEVIRWLRSEKKSENSGRDLTLTRPDGSQLIITNATDAEIARAEAEIYPFLASQPPNRGDG